MKVLHGRELHIGTTVERGTVSPPATKYGVWFWDTDEDILYAWDGDSWELVSGSPAADFTYWTPLAPPPSPSALDDEFDNSLLDAKWTEYDQTADLTVSEVGAGLSFVSTGGDDIVGVYQDVPAGDDEWSVVTRVHFLAAQTGNQKAGIFLSEDIGSNPATCDHETFAFYVGTSGVGLQLEHWSDYDTLATSHYNETELLPALTAVYIRVRLVVVIPGIAWDWYFDYSIDGISWIKVNNISRDFVPSEVGVFIKSNQADARVLFTMFRVFTADNDLGDIVLGDRVNGFLAS